MFWGNKKKENIEFSNIEIAVCTLLIHAARTDDSYSLKEKELIKTSLNKLGIVNLDYINRLIKYCEIKETDSVEIYNFTKEIKKFKYEYRLEIVEMMLKIIYSDKKLCYLEDRLIRKIAGLIYIENKDLGNLKRSVKNDIYSK